MTNTINKTIQTQIISKIGATTEEAMELAKYMREDGAMSISKLEMTYGGDSLNDIFNDACGDESGEEAAELPRMVKLGIAYNTELDSIEAAATAAQIETILAQPEISNRDIDTIKHLAPQFVKVIQRGEGNDHVAEWDIYGLSAEGEAHRAKLLTPVCTTCGNEGDCPDCGVWHTEAARLYHAEFESAQAAPVVTAAPVADTGDLYYVASDAGDVIAPPTTPEERGEDWQYDPAHNVFVLVNADETDWEAQDAYNAQWERDDTEAAYVATLADKGTRLAAGRDAKIADTSDLALDPIDYDWSNGYQDAANGKRYELGLSDAYQDGYAAGKREADDLTIEQDEPVQTPAQPATAPSVPVDGALAGLTDADLKERADAAWRYLFVYLDEIRRRAGVVLANDEIPF